MRVGAGRIPPGGLWVVLATVAGSVIALFYVWLTPPGLPYDEPAHWGNALFYAQQHRMPELGESGATYESQMGPGYYTLAGLGAAAMGEDEVAFYGVRALGVALIPVLVLVTYRLAMVLQSDARVAAVAASVVALNPLLLAISGSVQNDYLSITVGAVSVALAARMLRDGDDRLLHHAGIGALIGLTILVKVVAVSLLPALLVGYAVQPAPLAARARRALAAVAGCLAVCGWWFVRNLLLYGDLTGANGMADIGILFPPLRLDGVGDVAGWLGSVVSYAFVPVEYHRNVFDAPLGLAALAAAWAVATLAVGTWYVWQRVSRRELRSVLMRRPDRVFAVAVVVCGWAMYIGYAVLIWWIPARLLVLAGPVAAVMLAVATKPRWAQPLALVTVGSFVVVNVWLLVGMVSHPGSHVFLAP